QQTKSYLSSQHTLSFSPSREISFSLATQSSPPATPSNAASGRESSLATMKTRKRRSRSLSDNLSSYFNPCATKRARAASRISFLG
ncbi:hypothetical protein GBAR_LOCUS6940, partial [Geodia barretti]